MRRHRRSADESDRICELLARMEAENEARICDRCGANLALEQPHRASCAYFDAVDFIGLSGTRSTQ